MSFFLYPTKTVPVKPDNPNFQRLSQTVGMNIQQLTENVSSLSKMNSQLQSPQDSQDLRNQLRMIQSLTQKLAKDTFFIMIRLIKMMELNEASKVTRERLSDEYITVLNALQATQKSAAQKYVDEVKKLKEQNLELGSLTVGNGQSFEQLRNNVQETVQTEKEQRELEEKEKDIRQLENDIIDVNQIFKEVGNAIHTDFDMIYPLKACVDHTVKMKEVPDYNPKPVYITKKKFYLFVIALVIATIASNFYYFEVISNRN